MHWTRWIVVAAFAMLAGSCGKRPVSDTADVNPIAISEEYVRKHHPEALPRPEHRRWHIQDHGDIWTVELASQESATGGGVSMGIRKKDGAVIGSELTQ